MSHYVNSGIRIDISDLSPGSFHYLNVCICVLLHTRDLYVIGSIGWVLAMKFDQRLKCITVDTVKSVT